MRRSGADSAEADQRQKNHRDQESHRAEFRQIARAHAYNFTAKRGLRRRAANRTRTKRDRVRLGVVETRGAREDHLVVQALYTEMQTLNEQLDRNLERWAELAEIA